jgi:hypothetical protein
MTHSRSSDSLRLPVEAAPAPEAFERSDAGVSSQRLVRARAMQLADSIHLTSRNKRSVPWRWLRYDPFEAMKRDEGGWMRRRRRAIEMLSRPHPPTQARVARQLGVTKQAVSRWWKVHQSATVEGPEPRRRTARTKSSPLRSVDCGALIEIIAEEIAQRPGDDGLGTVLEQMRLLLARTDRTHRRTSPPWRGDALQQLRAMCEGNLRRRWTDLDADQQRKRVEAIERLREPTADAALVITTWTPVAPLGNRRRKRHCSLCGKTDHDRRLCGTRQRPT